MFNLSNQLNVRGEEQGKMVFLNILSLINIDIIPSTEMDNHVEDMSSKCDTTSLVEGAPSCLEIINFVSDYNDIHCG